MEEGNWVHLSEQCGQNTTARCVWDTHTLGNKVWKRLSLLRSPSQTALQHFVGNIF